jgi:tetratricopeptide (TPR) repeat protein
MCPRAIDGEAAEGHEIVTFASGTGVATRIGTNRRRWSMHQSHAMEWAAAALVLGLAGGCATPESTRHADGHSALPTQHADAHPALPSTPAAPDLRDDLGDHHQAVTTSSPRAQAYFDQGLRLLYGFDHVEAHRAFREAARLDPGCAMCYWGVAMTAGANYNSPTDPARERVAWDAVQKALAAADRVTPRERATIEAVARRHSPDPKADRATLDRAYGDAMREVVRRFPDDPDAATLLADALMNLRPWNLWTADGRPQPETEEILATLERVLARHPSHPGALHLYIHAVEASAAPGRGEAAADRLRGLVPGAGHLVHMPSHIYYRVGRYQDAHTVNVRAVEVDRASFQRRPPSMIYRTMYYPHNIDFVWLAASMEGRSAETIRAARELAREVPLSAVRQMPDMELWTAAPMLALVRFGRWEAALAEPAPPADLKYVTGMWRYARGLALAATGRFPAADDELAALRDLAASVPPTQTVAMFFKATEMLELAANVLAGEIAARRGDTPTAVRHLSAAVRAQDKHWFTEPPAWYYPVRQSLGAALLAGGQAAEAAAVYRADLERNPDNGWSLFGLARSLRAQGRMAEAAEVDARFGKAWARADVRLTSSRF